uniref:Uncharacterized protein n=1 Tax=Arundo donax TaxID=35708 RepID=A0A0A9DUH6_ARUDO
MNQGSSHKYNYIYSSMVFKAVRRGVVSQPLPIS